jgi:hypothetical protein
MCCKSIGLLFKKALQQGDGFGVTVLPDRDIREFKNGLHGLGISHQCLPQATFCATKVAHLPIHGSESQIRRRTIRLCVSRLLILHQC